MVEVGKKGRGKQRVPRAKWSLATLALFSSSMLWNLARKVLHQGGDEAAADALASPLTWASCSGSTSGPPPCAATFSSDRRL